MGCPVWEWAKCFPANTIDCILLPDEQHEIKKAPLLAAEPAWKVLDQKSPYPPPPGPPGNESPLSSLGVSATMASVVNNKLAMEAAFCKA